MPQINLLKDNRSSDITLWRSLIKYANGAIMVIIVLLLSYYAWRYFSVKTITRQTAELHEQIAKGKNAALKTPERQELITRQGQLKSVGEILAKHPYWSAILPKLAAATLKNASYMSLKVENSGQLNMAVQVSNTEALDKFLQIFDLGEYNQYFYNIKVGSVSNDQKSETLVTRFDMKMNYDPALLRFNAVNKK